MTDNKQLLDEVFVTSRIIKVEEGIISRSRRLRPITLTETLIFLDMTKPNLIMVLLYSKRKKKMVTTVSETDNLFLNVLKKNLRFSQFFLFHGLARSTNKTWKSCFCYFTDGNQHIARELDMITLN